MSELITNLLIGAGLGCIYGLIGLSFMGIYNVTGVLNFAQGDFAMLGAVVPSLFLSSFGIPIGLGIPLAILIAVFAALFLQYGFVEPLLKRHTKVIPLSVGTFGLSLAIEGLVGSLSNNFGTVNAINYVSLTPFRLGSVIVAREYVIIMGVTVLLTALYWIFLHKTNLGVALRAVGSNPRGAVGIGLPDREIRTVAFVISAVIAAGAGFLVAPLVSAGVSMGLTLVLNGFVASVVGGMGRAFAPLLGGIVLGELLSLVGAYGTSGYAEIVSFLLLLVVILIRPQGILGAVGQGLTDA